jgi:hypothetical protein
VTDQRSQEAFAVDRGGLAVGGPGAFDAPAGYPPPRLYRGFVWADLLAEMRSEQEARGAA